MTTLPLPTSAMLDAIGYQRGSLPETAAVSGERRSALRQWARLCGLSTEVSTRCSSADLRILWNETDDGVARHVRALHDLHAMTAIDVSPEKADTNDAESRLIAALREIRGAAIDESAVRSIVSVAVAEALANIPARRLEIKLGDKPAVAIEGRTHRKFETVLRLVQANVPVMLVGPAGCGKSVIAEQVAKALSLAFYYSGAVNSEYKLTGYRGPNGNYVSTAFRQSYECPSLFCFDEVDASAAGALIPINNSLANGHCDFPDGAIVRHPEWRIIATANTWGNGADRVYVGRNQLDGSFLDRFIKVYMDYDEELEREIAGNDSWVRRVQSVRKAVAACKVRHIVSPRASILGARALAAGVAQDEVEAGLLWAGLDTDTASKIKSHC